jgi:type VI protein secretion system component VasK
VLRAVLAALVLLVLAAAVWWVGPLVAVGSARPLESVGVRLAALGVLAILSLLYWRPDPGNLAVVFSALAVPVAGAYIVSNHLESRQLISGQNVYAEKVEELAAKLTPDGRPDEALPVLSFTNSYRIPGPDDRLDEALRRRLLTDVLLPRLLRRTEQVLRDPQTPASTASSLLKTYLSLADRRHLDRDAAAATLLATVLNGGSGDPLEREQQRGGLEAMLALEPDAPVVTDATLVAAVQARLAKDPPPSR